MFSTLQRSKLTLTHDVKRVLLRFLNFGRDERIRPVFNFIANLSEEKVNAERSDLLNLFQHRHFDCSHVWRSNYQKLGIEFNDESWSQARQELLGAYFTHEYSIESAALFNPSIVLFGNPDSQGVTEFVMSLRSTGEGHVSSISFLSGILDINGSVNIHERDRRISTGNIIPLQHEEDYDVAFSDDIPLNSRVLFPYSPGECNGMEDARFTRFLNEDGEVEYIATYTAYNGRQIIPKMIRTRDFQYFQIRRFHGDAVKDKGMALFPEKINGRYVMTGRQDGRHSTIMFSNHLHEWNQYEQLGGLRYDWDILQMGNCGSPVKTPDGWLLLTHAVGPMRRYIISAWLLDLNEPEKIVASLDIPLLQPNEREREGYVPNVLYTCGAVLTGSRLVIPYAMSDSAIGFSVVDFKELTSKMKPHA